MCKYDLRVNMNYMGIWIMSEYDLFVNMNYGWIRIMGEYDLCVNMNYGWIWNMGGGTDKHTHRRTHRHINTEW